MARIDYDEWKAHVEVEGKHYLYGDGSYENACAEAELLGMLGQHPEIVKVYLETVE